MSTTDTTTSLRILHHAEGDVHPVMGDPMRFIMTAEQSSGNYAIAEQEVRPGNGAPPHIHHREDESFYVLDGTIKVMADGIERTLGRGDFAHVPRGKVRSFTNVGQDNARVLIMHVPGSASGFYVAMGKLPFPPDIKDIAAIADRHGIEIVPPPGN